MQKQREMIEGPEAKQRFDAAMMKALAMPKSAMPPSPFKKQLPKAQKPAAPKD